MSRVHSSLFGHALALSLLIGLFLSVCRPASGIDTSPHHPEETPILPVRALTLNKKADGFYGGWYGMRSGPDKSKYKFSGGASTSGEKLQPCAVYCAKSNRTYFCFGGLASEGDSDLMNIISYYDHKTGEVAKPTLIMRHTYNDARENPVVSIDKDGYLWIFSSTVAQQSASYIHRSKKPYNCDEFELVSTLQHKDGREDLLGNFSFMQAYYQPKTGFDCFYTSYYASSPQFSGSYRISCFMKSPDGVLWSSPQYLASIERGTYQISASAYGKLSTMLNFHPAQRGTSARTNLYYMESVDKGNTWQKADGERLEIPLLEKNNPALIYDYQSQGLTVFLKDLVIDSKGNPTLLYITSGKKLPGSKSEPRYWNTAHWDGNKWNISQIAEADHDYDMGSLYAEDKGIIRFIAPLAPGPQPNATGGEIVMMVSKDGAKTWKEEMRLTENSDRNHSFVRRPEHANPDFYAFWCDGNPNAPSESSLYFCNKSGDVYVLPKTISGNFAKPALYHSQKR